MNPTTVHVNRPNMTQVGTIVWLSSELMFFAGLFAMYFHARAVEPELWQLQTELLNIPFALTNTIILVLSSVTCQFGVMAAERLQPRRTGSWLALGKWGMLEWYGLTYIMGAVFVAGQVYEYAMLVSEGLSINTNVYGSVFYLTTGFHGLHVTGGLVAFLLIMGRALISQKFTHRTATSAVVVSYYWHFVDVVWLGLFAVIYWLQ